MTLIRWYNVELSPTSVQTLEELLISNLDRLLKRFNQKNLGPMDWIATALLFMISWIIFLRWIGETDFTGDYHIFYAKDVPGVFPCLVVGFLFGLFGLLLVLFRYKRTSGFPYLIAGFFTLYAYITAYDYKKHLKSENPANEYILEFGTLMAIFVALTYAVIGILKLSRSSRRPSETLKSDDLQKRLDVMREAKKN